MRYEPVIGLELHIQLNTHSKLFSPSSAAFGAEANTHVNEIDLAYPGVLPVLNEQALASAVLFGLALGSRIHSSAVFMRKNYFYPDSPKGYQISQLNDAVILGGQVSIDVDGATQTVRINRGQLEEDAGKSVHDIFSDRTGIDLNRAGVPLIELVSEPDMHSAAAAVAYMRKIHHLVRYLGISDGNMQEGSFRCDANVSIRPVGSKELNARVELKNINSFRFVAQAIQIEIERQSDILDAGGSVEQETRLFDPEKMQTRTMRSKENANDYRYFPDPDLLPLHLSAETIEHIRAQLPELPDARAQRYRKDYQLDDETIAFLVQTRMVADYFDAVVAKCHDAKLAANWISVELARLLNEHHLSFEQNPVSAEQFSQLLLKIHDDTISAQNGKKVLDYLWQHADADIDAVIDTQGLRQISDDQALKTWAAEVLAAYPKQVADYRGGQEKLLGFFVGQVMKKSRGKANPKTVNDIISQMLQAE